MNTPLTLNEVIDRLIEDRLQGINTGIPAKVVGVDYEKCLVSVIPLIKDRRSDNRVITYEQIDDVPLFIYASAGNTARVTLPIKGGDVVALHFSQRDVENFLLSNGELIVDPENSEFLSTSPLYAVPSISTLARAKAISSTDIIIENNASFVRVTPDGTIEINTQNFLVNCVNATVNAQTSVINSSSTTINGNSMVVNVGDTTFNGNVSVNGNFGAGGGSFTHNGTDVGDSHTHGGVAPGLDNTLPPN